MNPNNPSSTPSTNPPSAGTGSGGKPTEKLKSDVADAKRSLTDSAKETAEEVRHQASGMIAQAKEKVSNLAEEQRENVADRIGSYSSALRESAHSVEDEDPNIAYYANQAAERIEEVASYVRTMDVARLRHDVEGVARRHPAVFMGSMFVAGLVVGNLVKASTKAAMGDDDDGSAAEDDEMYRPLRYGSASSSAATANFPDGGVGSGSFGGSTPGGPGSASSRSSGSGSLGAGGNPAGAKPTTGTPGTSGTGSTGAGSGSSAPTPPGTASYGRPETGI